MGWLEALRDLAARDEASVLVTVAAVRGHAPRAPGAKMVVAAGAVWGSVGGGNLEAVAARRAREMLEAGAAAPELLEVSLTERAGVKADFGVQCCGGEVTLLLEPVRPRRPQVAIFGAGHVGLALARVLSRLPLELVLSDSRPEMLEPARFEGFGAEARVRALAYPHPAPEFVMAELRPGACVVVLTHDHAEDLQALETALHRPDLGFVGLIGSSAKWARFRARLLARGFSETDLSRVTTPVGVPGVRGKRPEVIAIAVAAQLLTRLEFPEGA